MLETDGSNIKLGSTWKYIKNNGHPTNATGSTFYYINSIRDGYVNFRSGFNEGDIIEDHHNFSISDFISNFVLIDLSVNPLLVETFSILSQLRFHKDLLENLPELLVEYSI